MKTANVLISDQYCVCLVGETGIAVPAMAVREVTELPALYQVPASSSLLLGMCHLRNEFVPVISIAQLIGEEEDLAQRTSLVVLSSSEGTWAIAVDRALAISSLEIAHVQETGVDDALFSIVTGTATFHERVVRILEADRLYRAAVSLLNQVWLTEFSLPVAANS